MTLTRRFRSFVLASLGLYVLWFYFPFVDPLLFDEQRLLDWSASGYDAKLPFPAWYPYLWLVYFLIVAYGLYNFHRWSRDALIIGYLAGFLLAPVHGTTIQSPASEVVSILITLLDGIVIGMAYFSSVAERFDKKASPGAVRPQ